MDHISYGFEKPKKLGYFPLNPGCLIKHPDSIVKWSSQYWVGFHPLYTLNNQGFIHCSFGANGGTAAAVHLPRLHQQFLRHLVDIGSSGGCIPQPFGAAFTEVRPFQEVKKGLQKKLPVSQRSEFSEWYMIYRHICRQSGKGSCHGHVTSMWLHSHQQAHLLCGTRAHIKPDRGSKACE